MAILRLRRIVGIPVARGAVGQKAVVLRFRKQGQEARDQVSFWLGVTQRLAKKKEEQADLQVVVGGAGRGWTCGGARFFSRCLKVEMIDKLLRSFQADGEPP